MAQTIRYYESKLPITHEELYEMIRDYPVEGFKEWNFEKKEPINSNSIILSTKNCGDVLFTHPKESITQIKISADSKQKHLVLFRGLETFLHMGLINIPPWEPN